MNFFQSLSRPLRLAGFALLGVALVAVVLGTVTVVVGGNNQNTASPGRVSSSGAPATTSGPATTSASPTTTQPPASQPPAADRPSTVAPPTGGLPADQSGAKWVQVRVYNNSTIKGLAAQAAADLRADGWNVVEAANYPYGIIPTTTAYFTPGTDEETAAKALATTFGMHAEPRFGGIQDASPGVIVIVTNDYQGLHPKGS